MSVLLSDNLLLIALNLACLLMLSVLVLFALICQKHWQRRRRYRATAEIDRLLIQMSDPELFRESNQAFHDQLQAYYASDDYPDLLYAWTRRCQRLVGSERDIYCNNSNRCGLFDQLPENLSGHNPATICIALEVCGLAGMPRYIGVVESYSWQPVYAPFACHALVRMNFEEGMESLLRAYGHGYVNNSELLTICSEFSQQRLATWASQSTHWPMPEVLRQYWMAS